MSINNRPYTFGVLSQGFSETVISALSKEWMKSLLVFAFFFLTFSFVYLPLTVLSSSDDHFFHFRFAQVMRERGFFEAFNNFTNLHFSKITEGVYYPYYNFLFYLFIIPFTYINPLYLGIKVYAVCAVASFFTTLYAIARQFNVPHAFGWVVALFSLAGTDSILRLLSSRPYVLAPVLLILLIFFLYRRQYLLAGGISFLYLFWHSATFFMPLIVASTYYVFEYLYTKRRDTRNVISVLIGTGLALLCVSLIVPGYFTYLHEIIFTNVFNLRVDTFLPEGGELYVTDILGYIRQNSVLFSALIIAFCTELYTYFQFKRGNTSQHEDPFARVRASVFFLSIAFFAGAALVTGRFVDYLLPFFGLYLILALARFKTKVIVVEDGLKRYVAVGVFVALIYLWGTTGITLNTALASGGAPPEVFEGVGTWLRTRTTRGEVVFNPTWNWFPQLYYYSPNTDYIVGLEPRFLYAYNPRLFWLWVHISYDGYVCETKECRELSVARNAALNHPNEASAWYATQGDAIARVLSSDFKSAYIVSSFEFTALNAVLDNNEHFEKMYGASRTYYIYRLIP